MNIVNDQIDQQEETLSPTPEGLAKLLDKTTSELLSCRESLLKSIENFAKTDAAFLLVQRKKASFSTEKDLNPDVFAFVCRPQADDLEERRIDLVSMPYGSMLDNCVIFEDASVAQQACDLLNQDNEGLCLTPRTPSMVFYEQLTEIDRLLSSVLPSKTS